MNRRENDTVKPGSTTIWLIRDRMDPIDFSAEPVVFLSLFLYFSVIKIKKKKGYDFSIILFLCQFRILVFVLSCGMYS